MDVGIYRLVIRAHELRVIRLVLRFTSVQDFMNAGGQLGILRGVEELVIHLAGFGGGKDLLAGAVDEDYPAVGTQRHHAGGNRPKNARVVVLHENHSLKQPRILD